MLFIDAEQEERETDNYADSNFGLFTIVYVKCITSYVHCVPITTLLWLAVTLTYINRF